MIARRLGAGVAGVAVTFALFLLMHSLIEIGKQPKLSEIRGQVIDFVRLKEESETQRKERELPRKLDQKKPPPQPDINMDRMRRPDLGRASGNVLAIPPADLASAPRAGAALSDMDVVPLVRIAPQYPRRAAERGIEGWVLLEFTITAAGTVRNAVVVDAEPRGIFDREAIRAVEKFKYRPKIENGVPVERPGVQIVLTFKLEDAQ